ncbi:hypothetical protein [Fibrobacter sp. UWH1]|uniref:hypothetical protein n=1 Tax=Fibrobacter sp. UWH1 TaxID=1964354 RepID=UPI001595C62F|nr:hypothetical protein [Fibrobacter sp. UWH1]
MAATVGDAIFEDGEKRQAEETARRMLAENEPMEKIIAYTSLSREQIEALKK